MRALGAVILIAGVIGIVGGLSMKTSVPVSGGMFGTSEVNNIGLMENRRIIIMLAGLGVLLGGMLIGFSYARTDGASAGNVAGDLRSCPYCGESIKRAAILCRFCGKEVPAATAAPVQLQPLIDDLSSPDPGVRERAIVKLGDLGASSVTALDALRMATKDPTRKVRYRAEWAIEQIEQAASRRADL